MTIAKKGQLMLTNITTDSLLRKDHPYRKINEFLDFAPLVAQFESLYSERGAPGTPLQQGLRAMIVQFLEDYSDRQMESAIAENIAVKWFCQFELGETTPDHSYFGKLRKRLGTPNVAKIFNHVVEQMRARGLVSDVFHFIDSSAVITKTALWTERDKAISDGEKKLDNTNVKKYGADDQARLGCKGKNKYWYGYKRHLGVEMKSGAITKVAMTPANVPDGKALKHVCPDQGMVFADKAYCGAQTRLQIRARGCHSGVILKENMKGKDRYLDKWLTRVRMPYEGVFSKMPKRARYRGWAKVQMQGFMESIAHNLRCWLGWLRRNPELAT
jgi:IS5 family transposase